MKHNDNRNISSNNRDLSGVKNNPGNNSIKEGDDSRSVSNDNCNLSNVHRNISNIVSEIKSIMADISLQSAAGGNASQSEGLSISKINKINIMEVCGTHTMSIARFGIAQLLPPEISLISGPGCPVCVTSASDIDTMIQMIKSHEVTAFTFGDMFRVPGTHSSLFLEKSSGKDIRICYSPLDALNFAADNPEKKVVFIAIGFETTVPMTSVIIKQASERKLRNFSVFSTHKIVPPALQALLADKEVNISGLLLPGHVSVIIGSTPYFFIAGDYNIPGVIAGFDSYDILISILMILKQIKNIKASVQNIKASIQNDSKAETPINIKALIQNNKAAIQINNKTAIQVNGKASIEIEYERVVRPEGNPTAVKAIYEVFKTEDCTWRGLGMIAQSGLKIKDAFAEFDAKILYPVKNIVSKEPAGCKCGMVLKGVLKPDACRLFGKSCRPDNPVGPCMVSSEGTCAAYFKYLKFQD